MDPFKVNLLFLLLVTGIIRKRNECVKCYFVFGVVLRFQFNYVGTHLRAYRFHNSI